jgi:hypothetical protein
MSMVSTNSIHAMADAYPIFRKLNAFWKRYIAYVSIELAGPPDAAFQFPGV